LAALLLALCAAAGARAGEAETPGTGAPDEAPAWPLVVGEWGEWELTVAAERLHPAPLGEEAADLVRRRPVTCRLRLRVLALDGARARLRLRAAVGETLLPAQELQTSAEALWQRFRGERSEGRLLNESLETLRIAGQAYPARRTTVRLEGAGEETLYARRWLLEGDGEAPAFRLGPARLELPGLRAVLLAFGRQAPPEAFPLPAAAAGGEKPPQKPAAPPEDGGREETAPDATAPSAGEALRPARPAGPPAAGSALF
jgi:hypothetical protein